MGVYTSCGPIRCGQLPDPEASDKFGVRTFSGAATAQPERLRLVFAARDRFLSFYSLVALDSRLPKRGSSLG